MKTYKIDELKILDYVKRNTAKVYRTITYSLLLKTLILFITTQNIGLATLAAIMAFIFGWFHLNNKKLTRLKAENFKIIVERNSISRIINLDNEKRLGFFQSISYQKAKKNSNVYVAKIDFNQIKSVEKRKGDLWIKTFDTKFFSSKSAFLIPKELLHFEELEKEINEKLNLLASLKARISDKQSSSPRITY